LEQSYFLDGVEGLRPPARRPSSGMDFDVSCDSPNQSLMMHHLGDDF